MSRAFVNEDSGPAPERYPLPQRGDPGYPLAARGRCCGVRIKGDTPARRQRPGTTGAIPRCERKSSRSWPRPGKRATSAWSSSPSAISGGSAVGVALESSGAAVGKHVHHLAGRQPALHALPELHVQQVAVRREERLAHAARAAPGRRGTPRGTRPARPRETTARRRTPPRSMTAAAGGGTGTRRAGTARRSRSRSPGRAASPRSS